MQHCLKAHPEVQGFVVPKSLRNAFLRELIEIMYHDILPNTVSKEIISKLTISTRNLLKG